MLDKAMGRPVSTKPSRGTRHRRRLPRQRKSVRFDLRESVYAKLVAIADIWTDGSLTMAVERLIEEAAELPATQK